MVADPLEVLGDEVHVGGRGDVARVFHHVGQKLAEEPVIDVVHRHVAGPDAAAGLGILVQQRVDHVLEVALHQLRQGLEGAQPDEIGLLRDHHDALGDVAGIVADALQFLADLHRRDDEAQVRRHRRPQREEADAEALDLALQPVDRGVAGGDLGGGRGVAPGKHVGGIGHLALGEAAHAGDQLAQPAQVVAVGLDDVFGLVGHGRFPCLSRSGR